MVAGGNHAVVTSEQVYSGGWYSHKTATATFHAHLAGKLRKMGFVPTKADLDLWIRRARDGGYEYIASYVDDIIVISKEPMILIEKFKETYSLKGIGTPEYYLGGNFHKIEEQELLAKNIKTGLSARTYIENTIEKFERMFGGPLRESKFPMIEGLHPELDTSQLLDSEMATQYRAIIGSLNWVVILGRFDVMYATNTLARFSDTSTWSHGSNKTDSRILEKAFRLSNPFESQPDRLEFSDGEVCRV